MKIMMNNHARTASWLAACGKEQNNPQHLSVQIGCHLEEMAELLQCLRFDNDGPDLVLRRAIADFVWLSGKLKSGDYLAQIPPHKRVEALDALCDCEVTGNGVAWLAGFDKAEADKRVLDSNDSKLENGKPVILEGGKIGKGKDYHAPDLRGLV
jgi:hypothetical protein